MIKTKKRILSLLLTLCVALSLLPSASLAAEATFSDISGHWAANTIESWAARGVISGFDGKFRPNAPMTRAELAAVLNQIIGYTEVTNTAFADVPSDAWYYGHIARLYAAGIMQGDGEGVMRPNANVTREEAVVMIAKALDVEENAGNENPFPDADSISPWASFLVDGMKAAGYISGYPDGSFNPKADISRAEVVAILDNMITLYINIADEVDCELIGEIEANALVNMPGVTVKNLTINGDLWITEGVGSGDATLDNVSVSGTVYVRGGGPGSVHVTGGSFGGIVLKSAADTRLVLSEETVVGRVFLNAASSVARGDAAVGYDAAAGKVTVGGVIDRVALNADGSATITIGDIVYEVTPPEGALESISLDEGVTVKELILDRGIAIDGTGTIAKAVINADGAAIAETVDVLPENISAGEGIGLTIGETRYVGTGSGIEADTTDGSESRPFLVATPAQLARVGSGVYGWDLDKCYRLVADIEVQDWVPIGDNSDFTNATRFTGTFDGNGKTVTITSLGELKPYAESEKLYYAAGLFGGVGSGGKIKNLAVDVTLELDADSAPDAERIMLGGIVGTMTGGSVTGCSVAGTLTIESSTADRNYVGGVAGTSLGTVANCYSTMSVSASGSSNGNHAGGIVGAAEGTITYCYATGAVSASGDSNSNYAGGIASFLNGKAQISGSVALNAGITASGSAKTNGAGRIVHSSNGTLTNNYAVAISDMDDDGAPDDVNGLLIEAADAESEGWWSNSAGGIWRSVWGTKDDTPWQWDETNRCPVLYWQLP